ncbi:MAG TPA: hypothetical protein VF702_09890 [Allosphingosinicella sp.]|jgi:hypothetical protein
MESAPHIYDGDEIDAAILPSLSLLLDTLLDAAGSARPGIDAFAHAAEIRRLSRGLEELTRQEEALAALAAAAQLPARPRMSA